MRLPWVLTATALGAAHASCLFFTGTTDGYRLVDAGTDGGACASAADCPSDAGPQVCCLVLTATSAGSACGPQPCGGSPSAQFCKTDAECGSASCVLQKCALGGATVPIQACGNVSGCSP